MYDSINLDLRNEIQWPNNKIIMIIIIIIIIITIIIIILFIFAQICDTSNVYDNIYLGS